MGPWKTLGPDGLSAMFFQRYWHIVGPKVTNAVFSFFYTDECNPDLNATQIALILKNANPKCVSDYRPISLRNVIYKIISKVLVNRLKAVMGRIISEEQSAFIQGRLIGDNILIAYKILHSMYHNRNGTKNHVAIKLDMSKAYDRVEWEFLKRVQTRLGFCDQWWDGL